MHFFDRKIGSIKAYESSFVYDKRKKMPKYALDSSPNYEWVNSGLENIKKYNPDAKLIYLTRDPLSRFYSAYRFYNQKVNHNRELFQATKRGRKIAEFLKSNPKFSLENFFEIESSDKPVFHALERGKYSVMKNTIQNYFDESNVFYSSLEKLTSDDTSDKELARLGEFLKLDLSSLDFPKANFTKNNNESSVDLKISTFLEKYYAK